MNRKGFTLIELMIVVAIVGILAAVAIPQFAALVGRSQVNAERHKHGLPELTQQQYEKMYPAGPNHPPVDDTNTTSSNNSFSTTTTGSNVEVTCFARRINGSLFVDTTSCRANQ